MRLPPRTIGALVLLCFESLAVSGEETAGGHRPDGRPDAGIPIIVRPLDEPAVKGQLLAFGTETVSLKEADGVERSWRISDVRCVSVEPSPPAFDERPPVVLLANGDVLAGPVQSANDDALTLSWTVTEPPQPITLPLEQVRSFVLQQPEDDRDRIRLRRIWALLEPQADRLISTDNTHVDGELLGLADGTVTLKSSLGDFAAPVEEVIAVIMNSELADVPHRQGPYQLVTFRDGSRLSLASLRLDETGELSGTSLWGEDVSFPLERIVQVQFFGDRIVPLSDVTPASYRFTPFLTQQYPLVTNRNVHGGRLQLRGRLFATGLGVSSRSEVEYELPAGDYATFEALAGVDDMTAGQGHVVFAVEIDGRRVFESAADGRNAPLTVGPLDVAGAKRLTLVVDFGQFGNIQDVADWCEAVLIKPRD